MTDVITEPAVETTMETADPTTIDGGASAATDPVAPATETDPPTSGESEGTGAAPTTDTDTPDTVVTPAAPTTYMPIYNGQVMPIDANNVDEVTTLLQMGMKYRDAANEREQLAELAHAYGAKSVKEFVASSLEARDKAELDKAIAEYGQEGGKRYYEAIKAQRNATRKSTVDQEAEADRASKEAIDQRFADQFAELSTEYPEFKSAKDVPQAIVNMAIDKGISLLDAQNRYVLAQQKAAAAASARQQANQQASTGSVAGNGSGGIDPVIAAAIGGVHRR